MLIGMLILAFATLIPNDQIQTALLTFYLSYCGSCQLLRQINGARAQLSNFQGPLLNIKELLKTDNKTYLKDGKVQFFGITASY